MGHDNRSMDDKTTQPDRFLWRSPVLALVVALVLFVPLIISGDPLLQIAYFFLAVPVIGFFILIAAIVKKGRRRAALLLALVVFSAVSWSLFRFRTTARLHPIARWLLWSKDYKAQVLAQPEPSTGILKHIEWEAWGFPGAGNTTIYLVFDPTDSLSTPAKTHSSGKFSGLPCEVPEVRRMESQYYAVMFYTDSDWSHCN
jgi:hypothetical protein